MAVRIAKPKKAQKLEKDCIKSGYSCAKCVYI